MSERTPLVKRQDEEAFEVEEFEIEDCGMSPPVKYSLYVIATMFAISVLYFFTIYLPGHFIPESNELIDIIKVDELKVQLIPSDKGFSKANEYRIESSKRKVERLVLIGDIHGHYIQFRKLLRKINYDDKRDHILVLGDFITKGPDSIKVLDFLMKNHIDCIMGNHEYYVLQHYAKFHGKKFPNVVNIDPSNQYMTSGFNEDPEFLLAKKLQPDQIRYINNCPIIKKLNDVPLYKKKQAKHVLNKDGISSYKSRQGVAVHGGLRWDLSLYDQIPLQALEMRSLVGPYFNESTDDPHEINAVSWSKIWNQHQKQLPKDDALVAYYGHDARRGLNLKSYAKGLDTGCDRGDSLLAMILWQEWDGKDLIYKEKLVEVSC